MAMAPLLPLAALLAAAGGADPGTYANPVLVDTHEIRRASPAPYVGTLGIGDPAVTEHAGRCYLYPTGDNFSYEVYVSRDLVACKQAVAYAAPVVEPARKRTPARLRRDCTRLAALHSPVLGWHHQRTAVQRRRSATWQGRGIRVSL